MLVVIRADASLEIGTGHVMRCLALAESLRSKGAECFFVCREEDGHICDVVEARNFRCVRLPKAANDARAGAGSNAGFAAFQEIDARQTIAAVDSCGRNPDLLVVDHYRLDRSWESLVRACVRRIFVIDDLADRMHDCDLLLDQNLHDSPGIRYAGLVPEGAKVFVGPEYALLRPEFGGVPAVTRTRGLIRMLSFFGGADSTNESLKVVEALRSMGASAPQTEIVLGPANPHANTVLDAARGVACLNVIRQTDNMAGLMREADLGLGTCGVAAWERCCAGLPSLVVVSADNQRDDARILHSLGAVRNLGDAAGVGAQRWARGIRDLQNDPSALTAMSIAAASVMRGRGEAASRFEGALASILCR